MTYRNPQFMYFTNMYGNLSEIVNGARLSYLLGGSELCARGVFSDMAENGGCWALQFDPCTMDDVATGQFLLTSSWEPSDLSIEAAPWYNGSDMSAEAYGFLIEEWTGLDGAHHQRSSTQLGAGMGGARYGPQSHGPRVMKINMLIHGATDRGCNYLFRWLEQRLLECCACSTQQVWFREYDPGFDIGDIENGLARLNNVVLLDGPTWETEPVALLDCYIRRCSFTLTAGDPCLYGVVAEGDNEELTSDIIELSDDQVATSHTYWDGSNYQVVVPTTPPDYGVVAPVVMVTSNVGTSVVGRQVLPDIRIAGFMNPEGLGHSDVAKMIKVGELTLTGRGTSGLVIVVNMGEQTIKYRDVGSFGPWQNGSHFLGPATPGFKRWWTLDACYPSLIIAEPVYAGFYNSRARYADPPASFTLFVDTVNRWGCKC